MATTKRVTPGREGYKILFNENTVIMNYKFAAAAAEYGTKEYKIMKGIRRDFPGMNEIIVSGREQKSPRTNTRLTYENMKKYISAHENADELLEVFETVQTASLTSKSPYQYVCDWFKGQFPNYDKAVIFQNGKLTQAPEKQPETIEFRHKLGLVG